jgi:hypothetical protein
MIHRELAKHLRDYPEEMTLFNSILIKVVLGEYESRLKKEEGKLGIYTDDAIDESLLQSYRDMGLIEYRRIDGGWSVDLGTIQDGGMVWYMLSNQKPGKTVTTPSVFVSEETDISKFLEHLPKILGETPPDFRSGHGHHTIYKKLAKLILNDLTLEEAKGTIEFANRNWQKLGKYVPKHKGMYRALLSKSVWPTLVNLSRSGIQSTNITDRYIGKGFDNE